MGNTDLHSQLDKAQKGWEDQQVKTVEPDLFASNDVLSDTHAADLKTENSQNLPKKAGRPKGSKNKDTKELADYLTKKCGMSPLQYMYETFNKDTKELATTIGCKNFEAEQLKVKCAIAAAPFAHQKQPIQLDVTGSSYNLYLGSVPVQDGFDDDSDNVNEMPIINVTPNQIKAVEDGE